MVWIWPRYRLRQTIKIFRTFLRLFALWKTEQEKHGKRNIAEETNKKSKINGAEKAKPYKYSKKTEPKKRSRINADRKSVV